MALAYGCGYRKPHHSPLAYRKPNHGLMANSQWSMVNKKMALNSQAIDYRLSPLSDRPCDFLIVDCYFSIKA